MEVSPSRSSVVRVFVKEDLDKLLVLSKYNNVGKSFIRARRTLVCFWPRKYAPRTRKPNQINSRWSPLGQKSNESQVPPLRAEIRSLIIRTNMNAILITHLSAWTGSKCALRIVVRFKMKKIIEE